MSTWLRWLFEPWRSSWLEPLGMVHRRISQEEGTIPKTGKFVSYSGSHNKDLLYLNKEGVGVCGRRNREHTPFPSLMNTRICPTIQHLPGLKVYRSVSIVLQLGSKIQGFQEVGKSWCIRMPSRGKKRFLLQLCKNLGVKKLNGCTLSIG